jgi:glycine oxidase
LGFVSVFSPVTPDNAPLIGAVDERTVVATGHHRNGVLLAPVTADAVADLLTTGSAGAGVAPFGPDRFPSPEVAAWR